MADYLGPIVIGAAVAGIGYLGSRRNAGQAVRQKPQDLVRLTTPLRQDAVFALVARYASGAKMAVEETNEAEGRIILGQNMRGFHNGFFLPVYISTEADSMTLVEVGIQSKTYQASPVLNSIRNKAAEELRTMLNADAQRLSG